MIAFETFSAVDNGSGSRTESDTIETGSSTMAGCDNSSSPLTCEFGRPSYSAGGKTIVVSRLVPIDAFNHTGSQRSLTLVAADATGSRSLPRQTSDDDDAPSQNGNETALEAGAISRVR